jgi:hypothetical protein
MRITMIARAMAILSFGIFVPVALPAGIEAAGFEQVMRDAQFQSRLESLTNA